jgi:hypothetical protein
MDRKMAEQIVALANSMIDQLISTLEPVERAVTPEEFAGYKRGIAKVITAFDAEIIERVAREYPDLIPSDDDSEFSSTEPVPPKASRN